MQTRATTLKTLLRPHLDQRPEAIFFYPAEYDGPGTLTIAEFRCVLHRAHKGPHQVEEVR